MPNEKDGERISKEQSEVTNEKDSERKSKEEFEIWTVGKSEVERLMVLWKREENGRWPRKERRKVSRMARSRLTERVEG